MALLGKNDPRLAISGNQQSLFELDIERSKYFWSLKDAAVKRMVPSEPGVRAPVSESFRITTTNCEQILHVRTVRLPDGTIVRRFTPENRQLGGYKILKSNPQYLCCADFHGNIDLRSKDSLQVIHTFEGGAPNMINDMTVLGNQLVTCGYSEHYGRPAPNLYLRVYDLRMQKLVPQLLQMLFPPSFVK